MAFHPVLSPHSTKLSAREIIRAESGIASPFNPSGNPLPKNEIQRILDQLKSGLYSLEEMLLQSGVSKEVLLKAKAAALGGIDWVDFDAFQPDLEMVRLIPKETALRYNLLCIGKKESKLVVAMSDPEDAFGLEYAQMITGYEMIPAAALELDLTAQINALYPDKKQGVGISAKEAVEASKSTQSIPPKAAALALRRTSLETPL